MPGPKAHGRKALVVEFLGVSPPTRASVVVWPDRARMAVDPPGMAHSCPRALVSALDLGDRAGRWPTCHGPYGTNMSVRRQDIIAVGGSPTPSAGGAEPHLERGGGSLRPAAGIPGPPWVSGADGLRALATPGCEIVDSQSAGASWLLSAVRRPATPCGEQVRYSPPFAAATTAPCSTRPRGAPDTSQGLSSSSGCAFGPAEPRATGRPEQVDANVCNPCSA
jgi:hypothetical protein